MTDKPKHLPASSSLARTGVAAVMVTLSSVGMVKAMAATATMPILSKLIRAVEVTINTALDFGMLGFTSDYPGQVKIDPATGQLTTDGKGSLIQAGGRAQPGRLNIRGSEFPVQISMEQTSVHLTNGKTYITVGDFNFINSRIGPQVTVTPDSGAGMISIPLGATLKTRTGQMSGTYTGSNRIFANYQ